MSNPSRPGFHVTTIELPKELWRDLKKALEIRAARMRDLHGVDANASFASWIRQKADETIKAYR